MSGKGSTQRPKAVDEQTFEQNWERVFGFEPPNEIARAMETMPNRGIDKIEWLHEQLSGA